MSVKVFSTLPLFILAACVSVDRKNSSENNVVIQRHFTSKNDSEVYELAQRYCAQKSATPKLAPPVTRKGEFFVYNYNCIGSTQSIVHQQETDEQRCISYGAAKGTTDHVTCRLKLDEIRSRSDTNISVIQQPSNNKTLENQILLDSASRLLKPPQQTPTMPKTCSVVGGIMRCW